MSKKYLKLSNIASYKKSYQLSNYVWKTINRWNYFDKITVGKQFKRSTDSVSANIAEGFGRFNKKDRIRFYRISLGSVYESLDWNQKCYNRNLLNAIQYQFIYKILFSLPIEIRALIKFTNHKLTI